MELSVVIQHTDRVFADFERNSGWSLSNGARAVIREGIFGIASDEIGLRWRNEDMRAEAQKIVLDRLPEFLSVLYDSARASPTRLNNSTVIGAVYAIQRINHWAARECYCWPTDE
jgi:hypothetical protein